MQSKKTIWPSIEHIRQAPLPQRLTLLPNFFSQIVDSVKKAVTLKRVYLFGSRARGDAREHSDVDLGVEFETDDLNKWFAVCSQLESDTNVLLKIDLVDMSRCESALRDSIYKEGFLIYEH